MVASRCAPLHNHPDKIGGSNTLSTSLPPPPPEARRSSTPFWKRWWFWAIVVVVILIAAGIGSDPGEGGDEGASSPTAVTEPTTDETTSPEPSVAEVPNVQGDDQSNAVETLDAAGFTVDIEMKLTSAETRGTVLRQSIEGGTEAELGSTITLVVAKPLPVIPNVVGDKLTAARRTLKQRGFEVEVKKEGSSKPKDTVIRQSPGGGTSARPGRVVTLVVAKPLPSGGDGGNCTSGYSPCLPPASDYDCAGGTGDGPEFVSGPVRVTGSDPYGLDSDNDGIGCE